MTLNFILVFLLWLLSFCVNHVKKLLFLKMCTRPIQLSKKYKDGSSKTVTVPCGKCAECRAKKQSEFAALSVLEAERAGSIAFFTLTYDDGNLPMMCSKLKRYHYREYDSKKDKFTEYEDFEIVEQELYNYKNPCSDHFTYYDEIHASLCRSDVQGFLKRYRQDFFRRYGKRVDLRYSFFGEYGDKSGRPHYHMLVYGLDRSECERLRRLWQFGFTDMKFVTHFNSDGSDAYIKVSRYVSKYISKGEFLPEYVQLGLAEKPRQQSSIRLGVRDLDIDRYRNFILPATNRLLIDWKLSLSESLDLLLQERNFHSLVKSNN